MPRAQRKQIEALIANDEKLSKVFRVGETFSKLLTKEDYEKLAAGRVCKEWVQLPNGRWKCVLWADQDE